MGSILGELRPRRARTIVTGPAFRTCVTGQLCLYRDLSSSNRYYTCTNPSRSLVQAGHEVILQVERDDRCAALLRKRFPKASLTREVSDVKELPAETEILASSLNWPEQADDQLNDQVVGEHLRLPASCAATVTEHSHIFRLLAVRPVSWVLLELPVTLLRWVTASTPGREKIFTFAYPVRSTTHQSSQIWF